MQKRIRYNIKGPPQKNRKSFSLHRDVIDTDNQRKRIAHECYQVKDERIKAINRDYNKGNGSKGLHECWDEMRKLKKEFEDQESFSTPKIPYHAKNLKIIDEYMEQIYRKRKCLHKSKESMYYDLLRAVKLLGNHSLYVTPEEDLQNLIDQNAKNQKEQRRAVKRIRPLLKFINRNEITLVPLDDIDEPVKHLTLDELEMLIQQLKEDRVLKNLVTIAGKSGLRLSEIYGLDLSQLKSKKLLYVHKQLQPDGTRKRPKNKRTRHAFLLDGAYDAIKEWCQIPQEEKEAYRKDGKTIPNAVKSACRKLWPEQQEKHLNFRDLRHIMGVYLASNGVSTEQISKSLGNTPEICRKHYEGFLITEEGIEAIDKKLNSS